MLCYYSNYAILARYKLKIIMLFILPQESTLFKRS